MSDKPAGLELLRQPFPAHQIGKLAKGSKEQTKCPASEKKNCAVCGGWHHPKMIHLDYVGHAALTDRLLDADPNWTWEPLALKDGLPAYDSNGGLWIKLTICGVTRLGYGNAQDSEYKEVGSRDKEVIGDALRNAAMRFGAALELWHKGDLHLDDSDEELKKDVNDTGPSDKSESPGQIVDKALAVEGMAPEVVREVQREAKAIEGDFYTKSAKAALARWEAFKKTAAEQEIDACWRHIESKVRSGIKKYGEAYANA